MTKQLNVGSENPEPSCSYGHPLPCPKHMAHPLSFRLQWPRAGLLPYTAHLISTAHMPQPVCPTFCLPPFLKDLTLDLWFWVGTGNALGP